MIARNDRGFGLVELAVYVVVLGLIATVVASVIVSLFSGQRTVAAISTAASSSQIATTQLTDDVRNARELRVVASGAELRASVAQGNSGWQCVRWRVADGALSRSVWAEGAPLSTATSAELATGVTPLAGGSYFSLSGGGNATQTGKIRYSMRVGTVGAGAIDMSGAIANRMAGPVGTSCFD